MLLSEYEMAQRKHPQEMMVIISLLAVLSLAQSLDTLYVKPTPDTPCGEDPCLTLTEYADNPSQYFTRDTEAVFLSGQHLLGRDIMVSDIAVFIMHQEINASQAHPQIVCTEPVGLAFFNVSFLSITELSFVTCGNGQFAAPVLYIQSVGIFFMANATVKMAHASAIFVFDSNFYSVDNCFQDNTGYNTVGGSIDAVSCNVNIANSQFYNNAASYEGGAVHVTESFLTFSGTNIFTNNEARVGGALYSGSSVVSFEGTNSFIHNSATLDGGAIQSDGCVTNFSGTTIFMDNSVSSHMEAATAALSSFNCTINFTGNTTFIGNGPSNSSLFIIRCGVVIEGYFNFVNNQGRMTTITSNVTIRGIANFINNSAPFLGSALGMLINSRVTFLGTTLFAGNIPMAELGYGAVTVISGTLQFIGHTTFTGNTANTAGAAISAVQASVMLDGTQSFEHNVASGPGGAIYMLDTMVNIKGCSSFINNSAGRQGGAISNINGQLSITGNASLIGNQARSGGGLSFDYFSQLLLNSPLALSFQNNSAQKGGAIFVNDGQDNVLCSDDSILGEIGNCFIRIESLFSDVQLDFDGNTAIDRGDNIFGGMLDKCYLNNDFYSSQQGLSLLNISDTSTISSGPQRLCYCVKDQQDCTYEPPPFSIVRGATISVSAVALDQVNHTVTATVRSYIPYNNGTVSDVSLGQGAQQIGATCTSLNYTILTTESYVTLVVFPEGPCGDTGNSVQLISVHLIPCPIGFELSNVQCICEKRLQPFTNSCSAGSQTFSRTTDFWVGTEYRNGNYTGLILHSHCPLDYCISSHTDISVNDLDSQCSFNHSGILCGSCRQNLSLALGSSQCLRCSNSYLALLIPFAVAGVALVFVLFTLRLTLSFGTLSGLIFYANIIAVNKEIFFQQRTTDILTVFIAWLNLDLGIEACFFDGMDTYTRAWLQYVFPVYIWLMVSIIIITSHYSVRVPKLLGRNPIAVLATLFLLSYAKLLRTIIASFSATVLDYPDNSTATVLVWLYDGNIGFLRGKHIPLFLFSLVVLLFLFLPYTLFLFLSQWLQAHSNNKLFFWMNSLRVKAFLDAYHAPYNIKHRYWTGLLLLLRCVLFLVFASNTSGDPSINLLAITSVALGLAVLTRLTGQVYSKWWLDILESSFILNLGVIAAATYHVMLSGGSQSAVASLSVSVAFIEFAGIILYHMYLQLKGTAMWNSAIKCAQKLHLCNKSKNPVEHDGSPTIFKEVNPNPPSTTFISLREPMLDFPS